MNRLQRYRFIAQTLPQVGWGNAAFVAWYRASLRLGFRKFLFPSGKPWADLFFEPENLPIYDCPGLWWKPLIEEVGELHRGVIRYFACHRKQVGSPPQWFHNPFNQKSVQQPERHWTGLKDFDSSLGDIKIVWEASRFRWAPMLARAYRMTGEHQHLELLNAWIADWTERNPTNRGPNWKCGQEAGIRLIHTLLAAWILGCLEQPNEAVRRFVRDHCHRIELNIRYALAQDNNHGTSEAAALFLGGLWLVRFSDEQEQQWQGDQWAKKGRELLENRIGYLIEQDGGFSQYSVTYHRLMQDTINITEWMRRRLGGEPFSPGFYQLMRAATQWLYQVTDPTHGDAPNLGWNDGSFEFLLCNLPYRDFRPTVQLSAALFLGQRFYDDVALDEPLFWLGLTPLEDGSTWISATNEMPAKMAREGEPGEEPPHSPPSGKDRDQPRPAVPPHLAELHVVPRPDQTEESQPLVLLQHTPERISMRCEKSGFVMLSCGDSWGLLRTPTTRFRPPHADLLHFDLWYRGKNVLRDSGSYSYNGDPQIFLHLTGTEGHNTVRFDNRDQMPRLSRFMFGPWVAVQEITPLRHENGCWLWAGEYRDTWGCHHRRTIRAEANQWTLFDEVGGFNQEACLRWRLAPGAWQLTETGVKGRDLAIETTVEDGIKADYDLEKGWESRHYWEAEEIPVLAIRVNQPTRFTTRISFPCPKTP